MSEELREKVIKGLELCLQGDNNLCELSCPYYHQCGAFYENNEALLKDALSLLKAQDAGWISADNRPPSQGRYLVYGLTNFVPDHIDQPNAYWEVKIVKYWMPLPEPPKEE